MPMLVQVCLACARHCHRGHGTDAYIAAKQTGDKVGLGPVGVCSSVGGN